MDVYWLEQTEAEMPAENHWLSATEALCLNDMRFPKRRTDWRLGRWTAKRAVTAFLSLPGDSHALASIEIRPTPSGAPEVCLPYQTLAVTISLSHSAGSALCAIAEPGSSFGCDLETVEPRSDAFVADYFTVNEQLLIEQSSEELRPLLVTLLWSAKESTLKALRVGLRLDTRCVDVRPVDAVPLHAEEGRDPLSVLRSRSGLDGWTPLRVRYSGTQVFRGWWRHADGMVRTVVSALPLSSPLRVHPGVRNPAA